MPNKLTIKQLESLLRSQMKGIDLNDIYLEELPEDEYREMLKDLYRLKTNKGFFKLINEISNKQVFKIAVETQNMEQVNYGRALINGLTLLKEAIEKYNAIYESKGEKEFFDKDEVI